MNFYTLSGELAGVFSHSLNQLLLELSNSFPWSPLAFQAVLSSGWEDIRGEKKINSPPVQWYSKFWSSSPNYLLLLCFRVPHPLSLVFIVAASQYNQVEYVFHMIQNWKFSPTFFEPGQSRAWDLIHWAILVSSITTTAPWPWVYLPQPLLLPSLPSKSSIGIACNWSRGNFKVWHTEDYIEPRQLTSISSFRDQFLLFKN